MSSWLNPDLVQLKDQDHVTPDVQPDSIDSDHGDAASDGQLDSIGSDEETSDTEEREEDEFGEKEPPKKREIDKSIFPVIRPTGDIKAVKQDIDRKVNELKQLIIQYYAMSQNDLRHFEQEKTDFVKSVAPNIAKLRECIDNLQRNSGEVHGDIVGQFEQLVSTRNIEKIQDGIMNRNRDELLDGAVSQHALVLFVEFACTISEKALATNDRKVFDMTQLWTEDVLARLNPNDPVVRQMFPALSDRIKKVMLDAAPRSKETLIMRHILHSLAVSTQ